MIGKLSAHMVAVVCLYQSIIRLPINTQKVESKNCLCAYVDILRLLIFFAYNFFYCCCCWFFDFHSIISSSIFLLCAASVELRIHTYTYIWAFFPLNMPNPVICKWFIVVIKLG